MHEINGSQLSCLDHKEILCIHGDKVKTQWHKLGRWSKVARVVVIPGIHVLVLLEVGIYELTTSNPLMAITRSQAMRECTSQLGQRGEYQVPCQTTES